MDWVLAYHELLIRLKQWCRLFEIWIHSQNHFFRLRRWFPPTRFSSIRSLKSFLLTDISWALPHSLCWNQLYFCDLPFLSLTLFEGCSEFRRISHLRYLRLKKSVHLSAKEIHTQTRSSVWEFSLPLQRFVSTNFLTEVILFNNIHT